ncbi:MAG: homoserine dehydrogenase [Chloroflexi bacterium]|nr:homoserine dehydrogenase [Chloroflexota bacterium]
MGVVGSAVVQALGERAGLLAERVGYPLRLTWVLVQDLQKRRRVEVPPSLLTNDFGSVVGREDTDIVVEVMGGEEPAHAYILQALESGLHVVTANKEVMAKHGPELLRLARERGTNVLYEASVGAGIPLVSAFTRDLAGNRIDSIRAIINGTTNYLLTRMGQDGLDFSSALRLAQELGYAEADPTNDVEGIDAAYKLAILAALAFRTPVTFGDVYHEGISRLNANDFRYARELGYAIKLLAIGRQEDGEVQVRVHPAFVHQDLLLAKVEGVFNAVQVEGDLAGRLLFYGPGAGAFPTTSAVLGDVVDSARQILQGGESRVPVSARGERRTKPMADLQTRYYMRMTVADRAGVLAKIAQALGDNRISIASVIQKETDEVARTAEIVIMTHRAREAAFQAALRQLAKSDVVHEVGNFVRVED